MAYQDNESKFVVVLNSKIAIPRLANAMLHAMIGLSSGITPEESEVATYESSDGGFSSLTSRYPVIVLEAKNSSQLKSLFDAARAEGITANAFVGEMIAESHDVQLEQVRSSTAANLDYWVVALFGDSERLRPMTKKFSLMRDRGTGGPS